MSGEKPEVGVKLILQNLTNFESEIDRAIQKVQQAKKEIEVSLRINFVAVIPQSDLDNVKANVQRTAKEERRLKNRKKARALCPICNGKEGASCQHGR